jgi:hypothetical protein
VVTIVTAAAAAALVGIGLGAGWLLRNEDSGNSLRGLTAAKSCRGVPLSEGALRRLGPVLELPPGQTAPGGALRLLPGGMPRVIHPKPGVPFIAMSQPVGDRYSDFVVHGGNWPPGTSVTISLIGCADTSVSHTADAQGTVNFVINQGDNFFRTGLRDGVYAVRAVGAGGGGSATARFAVTGASTPGDL